MLNLSGVSLNLESCEPTKQPGTRKSKALRQYI